MANTRFLEERRLLPRDRFRNIAIRTDSRHSCAHSCSRNRESPLPLSIHSTRNYVAKNENFTSELFIPREREKNLKLRNVNFYRQFYALSAPRKYIYIYTKIHLKLTDYYSLQNRDPHKRIPLFSSLSAQSRSSIVTKERKERKDD